MFLGRIFLFSVHLALCKVIIKLTLKMGTSLPIAHKTIQITASQSCNMNNAWVSWNTYSVLIAHPGSSAYKRAQEKYVITWQSRKQQARVVNLWPLLPLLTILANGILIRPHTQLLKNVIEVIDNFKRLPHYHENFFIKIFFLSAMSQSRMAISIIKQT